MSARNRLLLPLLFSPFMLLRSVSCLAQDTGPIGTPVPPAYSSDSPPAKPAEQADSPGAPAPSPRTSQADAMGTAWAELQAGVSAPKDELRISALAAVGTLNGFPQAQGMVRTAIADKARYVRLAAVAAASTLNERELIPDLQKALDDPAAEVSFAAAQTLWRMGDHSGESILAAVLAGERKPSQSFIGSQFHTAHKDLHSPSTLALIGAEQGGYALLGPFGIGIDAARMLTKGKDSPNSARVQAANLLADLKTLEINKELIAALRDSNYFVRSSAARALGTFHTEESRNALLATFGDVKPLVRYMAQASYIRSASPEQREPSHPRRTRKSRVESTNKTHASPHQ